MSIIEQMAAPVRKRLLEKNSNKLAEMYDQSFVEKAVEYM